MPFRSAVPAGWEDVAAPAIGQEPRKREGRAGKRTNNCGASVEAPQFPRSEILGLDFSGWPASARAYRTL